MVISRRVLIWSASGVAAALVIAGGVVGTIRYTELNEAQNAYETAMDRWESSAPDTDDLALLQDELSAFTAEIDVVTELSTAMPESLVGADGTAALAAAATAGATALEEIDADRFTGELVDPHRGSAPEGVDELTAAAGAIESAIADRADLQQDAQIAAEEVASARTALGEAADGVRAQAVEKAASISETLTSASPESLQAVTDASATLSAAELAECASAATALVAALDAAQDEHDTAVEAEAAAAAKAGANSGDPASITVVVNKQRPLGPIDWAPSDLRYPVGIANPNGHPVRAEAATALEAMYADASAAGVPFIMISGFRNYDYQTTLFNNYVARDGVAAAETYSARPGHSEHQTGLAVDLDDGSGCILDSCFGETGAGQWLRANAHRYGFILRYDAGQQPTVGFMYEPWHFRYVGTTVSEDMHAKGIVNLEDYFGLPAAPTY